MNVQERITELRKLMKERKIDVYYIPNEDDHLSEEYTADFFKCKSWMSGFSGDAGCTIITQDFAGLWTDGRYFTAAEEELKGTGVELMRLRQAGVPDPLPFIIDHTPAGGKIGFDGSVVSAETALALSNALRQKKASIHISEDLVGMVWKDRPPMPQEPLWILKEKYTGMSAKDKIAMVRADMKEKHADVLVLTMLEDPCWLLNIRGNDIPCTPVSYAFAMITARKVYYYIDKEKVPADVKKYLKENGATVRPYKGLAKDLAKLADKTIWAQLSSLNVNLYAVIQDSNRILNEISPIMHYRSVKNAKEIRCMHSAQVKDGVAMVRFLRWFRKNVGKDKLDELTAAKYLDAERAEQKLYVEPSFETISAYQANAAMMHYTATPEHYAHISPKGFLLVDSGGTYKDGSTDITRTIACGPLSDEEKKYYTLVLKGHLDLMAAVFLQGTTGNNLDILARRPLWNLNIDYQCGTGHGVGHVLGVHEGVHGIRWGQPTPARPSVPFEPGMIVTDEPGVYMPHKLGIRIENDLLVVKDQKNFYGQWLKFEPMTYCPYEREAIDPQYLDDTELEQLNAYHQMVYEKLSPKLTPTEARWLKKACAKIRR
jgi:Xaa-Pro aminopeptidase